MAIQKPKRNHVISWQEAIAIMEDTDAKGVPRPFSIMFCTADESRQTGGDIIRYEQAVWHINGGRIKTATTEPKAAKPGKKGKSPNHNANWTRNIRALNADQIRKLHIHLILEINNLIVR